MFLHTLNEPLHSNKIQTLDAMMGRKSVVLGRLSTIIKHANSATIYSTQKLKKPVILRIFSITTNMKAVSIS